MHSSEGILLSRLPAASSSITVGNGAHIPVTSRGSSVLPTDTSRFILNNVLIVPSIIRNLLSVRQFTRDNRCSIEFDASGFSVKDIRTGRVILRCDSTGDLYTIPSVAPAAAKAMLAASSSLWHRRLGHPGPAVLATLKQNNLVSCNKVDRSLCHACQLGKHARLPFATSTSQTTSPFEIVHCDVWTSPVASISGCSYYLVLLDDFSHYCWTFPLKHKSDVHQHIVDFIAYARTQFGLPVKCFQADNGTEFVNHAMHTTLRANGVIFHLSCPYTSPQNGKAERILRTLNNSVRTLLIHASMPPKYWAEALAAATYLLNRRPSSSISNVIPYFRLYNAYPSYDHLRVFGCLCYPNLQATSSHKLAPRSTACVFLGYPPDHKGYRCFDLTTRRIIISRHVVFDESTFPFARETHPPTTSSFDFLLGRDLDIAPLFTNHAAGGSPTAAPSSIDVEQPCSAPGGSGVQPPLGPSASSSPGGCGFVPPSGPSASSSTGGTDSSPLPAPATAADPPAPPGAPGAASGAPAGASSGMPGAPGAAVPAPGALRSSLHSPTSCCSYYICSWTLRSSVQPPTSCCYGALFAAWSPSSRALSTAAAGPLPRPSSGAVFRSSS